MKKHILNTMLALASIYAIGQSTDSTESKVTNVKIGPIKIKVTEENGKEEIKINNLEIKSDEQGDQIVIGDVEIEGKSRTASPSNTSIDLNIENPSEKEITFQPGIDFGLSGYVNTQKYFNLTGKRIPECDISKSRNFAINGFVGIDISKYFGIVTGLRYNFNKYVFSNVLHISTDSTPQIITNEDIIIMIAKPFPEANYRLNIHSVQIPLMFKIQSQNKDFQCAFGVMGGYNYSSFVRNNYIQNGNEFDIKYNQIIKIEPFSLSLTGRFNYKGVGLYGSVGLNSIMQNSGMQTPFTLGLTLNSF